MPRWNFESDQQRFETHINKDGENGCWLWTGGKYKNGYGEIQMNHKMTYAHRVAFEFYVGKIPEGLSVLHKCDIRACCNPEHLFLGTDSDNARDMIAKGRHSHGEAHSKIMKKLNLRGERSSMAKLNREDVNEIRSLRDAKVTQSFIAKLFGISRSHVSRIEHKVNWTDE